MKPEYIEGGPLPETMGRCGDLFKEVQAIRLAMQREVDEVKRREAEIKNHIIDHLSKSDDTGAVGLRYRVQVTSTPTPSVKDWGVFHSWVRKNDYFHMLQKRVNPKAVRDFSDEEGKLPPGTEIFNKIDLSVTKR